MGSGPETTTLSSFKFHLRWSLKNGNWDYSFKSIIESKTKDLRTWSTNWFWKQEDQLPEETVPEDYISEVQKPIQIKNDQQTNSENKKTNSQKRLLDCYLWFPTYIHEVFIAWRIYIYIEISL